jgi:hypothetical protein
MKRWRTGQALHALTLTCHKFRAIATPHLYTYIVLPRGRTQTLALLLWSLLSKPDAARSIQYIEQYEHTLSEEEEASYYTDEDLDLYAWGLAPANWRFPDSKIPFLFSLIPDDGTHMVRQGTIRAAS